MPTSTAGISFFMEIDSRCVHLAGGTASPTGAWVRQSMEGSASTSMVRHSTGKGESTTAGADLAVAQRRR